MRLRVGFDAKEQVVPQRQLELICPLPAGASAPQRLGAFPWALNREALSAAKPRPSAWGSAWLLLQETGDSLDLQEFCDLVYGSTEPVQLSACWLALVGEQHWFRWKQGSVQARSLEELKPLRRARRRQAIAEAAEGQWHRLLKQREPIETSTCSALQLERLELLKQVASGRLELEQLPDGMRQSLSQLHLGQERSQVRHLLVDLGQWDPHQLVSLEGTVFEATWNKGLGTSGQQAQFTIVPAPGAMALLGLAGLAGGRRRRNG